MKKFSVRLDDDLLDKLHIASAFFGRSANAQAVYLFASFIQNFEKRHGEIALKPRTKQKGEKKEA